MPLFLDPKSAGLGSEKPFIGPINKITEATKKLRTMQEEYNAAIGQFGHTFANSFSNALTSQEGFFKSFISNLKSAIAQQLAMLAGLQIASALFGGTMLGEGLPTSCNVTDYSFVRKKINELSKKYRIQSIAYDRWNASQLVIDLVGDGANMSPLGQGFASLSRCSNYYIK